MSTPLHPLFLNLKGRNCVLVGGNEAAETKIRDLLDSGAKIEVIASVVSPQITAWSQAGMLHWEARDYQHGDLRDAFLVVSVADPETNARVFAEAEARRVLCNAVDDIEHCNCYAAAVVRRGPLQIAISTAGQSPAFAQRLRNELEVQFDADYAPWVEKLGELRSRLLRDEGIDSERRRAILHEQASASSYEAFRSSLKEGSFRQGSGENSNGADAP